MSVGNADPFVAAVMEEMDINLQEHEPKMLEEVGREWFDLVVTHSPQAHHVALSMNPVKTGDVIYLPAGDPNSRARLADTANGRL